MMANLIFKSISCFRKFWTFNCFPSKVHPKCGVDGGMGGGPNFIFDLVGLR